MKLDADVMAFTPPEVDGQAMQSCVQLCRTLVQAQLPDLVHYIDGLKSLFDFVEDADICWSVLRGLTKMEHMHMCAGHRVPDYFDEAIGVRKQVISASASRRLGAVSSAVGSNIMPLGGSSLAK